MQKLLQQVVSIHSQGKKKGKKAVTGAVPFKKERLCTLFTPKVYI